MRTKYLDQVRSMCSTNLRFVQAPLATGGTILRGGILPNEGIAPTIKYKQQELGENTCLTALLASALHCIGITQIASELVHGSKNIMN